MEIKTGYLDTKEQSSKENKIRFVLSSDNVDRDFEMVDVLGLNTKNFLNNPVMYFMHNSYQGFNIGKWNDVKKKKIDGINYLFGTPQFNELDDESVKVKKFVEAGELNMSSIGFIPTSIEKIQPPKEYEDVIKLWNYDGLMRVIKKAELLEASIVGIGSNPDALVQKVNKGLITNINDNDIKWFKDRMFDPHKVFFFLNHKSLINEQLKLFDKTSTIGLQGTENPNGIDYTINKEIFDYDKINVQFVQEKQGAVLSKKNKAKLVQATELINEVLSSSEPEEDNSVEYFENSDNAKSTEILMTTDEILSILD